MNPREGGNGPYLSKLGAWSHHIDLGDRRERSGFGEMEENLRDQEGRVGQRIEKESHERDTLLEGAIMGLNIN